MSNATKWNSKIQWPKDNYILRCINEDFGQSRSSNNPMITLEFEVVSPEECEVAGKAVLVSGVKLSAYYITKVLDEEGVVDTKKTAEKYAQLEELYKAFGLSFDDFNPDNPTLGFKGRCVHALLYGKTEEQRKSPTAEQLKEGKRVGDVIINPVTKQPMIQYKPQIDTIYGLAEVVTSSAI